MDFYHYENPDIEENLREHQSVLFLVLYHTQTFRDALIIQHIVFVFSSCVI